MSGYLAALAAFASGVGDAEGAGLPPALAQRPRTPFETDGAQEAPGWTEAKESVVSKGPPAGAANPPEPARPVTAPDPAAPSLTDRSRDTRAAPESKVARGEHPAASASPPVVTPPLVPLARPTPARTRPDVTADPATPTATAPQPETRQTAEKLPDRTKDPSDSPEPKAAPTGPARSTDDVAEPTTERTSRPDAPQIATGQPTHVLIERHGPRISIGRIEVNVAPPPAPQPLAEVPQGPVAAPFAPRGTTGFDGYGARRRGALR